MWAGAGLLGATNAPFAGDVTQGELLHPLPGSLCSHPGILRFFSVLPLQFASTPLAAGKCLLGVSGFLCSEVPREALITPDLVQLTACGGGLHQATSGAW